MSELYTVYISDRPDDTTVDMKVKVVHPDSMYIYKTPGFYLMLLQECTKENNLLAEEVDYDSVTDAQWLKKYAKGFIKSVKILKLENKMPKAAESNGDHKYWKDSSKWMSGIVRVTVTHPGWCQHATEGVSWESASYDPNSKYDACPAIVPGSEDVVVIAKEDGNRTGFLPIPNYFFSETLPLPSPVWIPVYGEKAYVAGDKIMGKDLTDEVRDSLLGVPAIFKDSWSESLGVLCTRYNGFTIDSGSYGSLGAEKGDLEWIAPVNFNHGKKRLNEPLSYQKILEWVDPHIPEISLKGNTASFLVYTFSPGKQLKFDSAADPMALICRSITDRMESEAGSDTKLGSFLNDEKEKRDLYSISDLYGKLAGGMIKKWNISKLLDASHPNLDSLDHKKLITRLDTEPWATWKVEVEVTDPAWIEHLVEAAPYSYGFYWVEEAEKWTEAPLLYPKSE